MEVVLRQLLEPDKDALAEQANNKKIWLNLRNMFPHPYHLNDAENFITLVHSDDKNTRFAIEYDNDFAGMIGLFPQSDVYEFNAELGYWIGEKYWGKGIGTRAVELLCNYCFSETEIQRIFAGVFDYNQASMRVLEKNGFMKEGISKRAVFKDGKFHDEVRYAKLKVGK